MLEDTVFLGNKFCDTRRWGWGSVLQKTGVLECWRVLEKMTIEALGARHWALGQGIKT